MVLGIGGYITEVQVWQHYLREAADVELTLYRPGALAGAAWVRRRSVARWSRIHERARPGWGDGELAGPGIPAPRTLATLRWVDCCEDDPPRGNIRLSRKPPEKPPDNRSLHGRKRCFGKVLAQPRPHLLTTSCTHAARTLAVGMPGRAFGAVLTGFSRCTRYYLRTPRPRFCRRATTPGLARCPYSH